ncbi:MAG TPA: LEA type 2 family protein [Steroidobacteraceae bacterium]
MSPALTPSPVSHPIRLTRSAALLAVALIAAGLPAACAVAPKLEAPKLSIVGVQVMSAELWAQHLKVRLHVHNPNDRELPVKGLEYTIEIAGKQVATGESATSFVVPPRGDAEFDTNVTTDLAGATLKLLTRGPNALAEEVPYRLSGKVSLASGLWRSIPFDGHGSFKP